MRLERARWETEQTAWYDHVVVNEQVDACADEILNIIASKCVEE
jgi:guanylate kinase